jgi:hypothetical protein
MKMASKKMETTKLEGGGGGGPKATGPKIESELQIE